MKHKTKKTLIIALSIIVLALISILVTYKIFFYPKLTVKPINSNIIIDTKDIQRKFLPKKFNLGLNEIKVQSYTTFSEEELTDIFIETIKSIPELQNYLQGISVKLEDDDFKIIFTAKCKSIPFQGSLDFKLRTVNGLGVISYEKGNIGFIDIKKKWIFNNLHNSDYLIIDKDRGEFIISLKNMGNIEVKEITVRDNSLYLSFQGKIKLWDWLLK